MNDEKMKILKMIEDGTITSEEGLELIEALESKNEVINVRKKSNRWLKIKVTEGESAKVNISIPFVLAKAGLKLGQKYSKKSEALDGIDFDEIIDSVKNGAEGKLVEVKDGNELVEIYVE